MVCLLAGLPAVVVSLLIAEARYGIALAISPSIVPAKLPTAFAGTMIGYGLGHAIPDPMVTNLVTELLIFAVFGFCPILYPAWQLPAWLAALNWWFPFGHMAVIVRAGLTAGMATGVSSSYVIVAVWGIAGGGGGGVGVGAREAEMSTALITTRRSGIGANVGRQKPEGTFDSIWSLMAVSVGFGMALAIRNPLLINLITNALIFVVLLFSPIVTAPSHFPAWLLTTDRVLPFYNMAEVIRAGLSRGLVTDLTRSYLILLGWTAAGWGMTGWVVGRRR